MSGTEPATQACALIRNRTPDLSVYGVMLQPTETHWPQRRLLFLRALLGNNPRGATYIGINKNKKIVLGGVCWSGLPVRTSLVLLSLQSDTNHSPAGCVARCVVRRIHQVQGLSGAEQLYTWRTRPWDNNAVLEWSELSKRDFAKDKKAGEGRMIHLILLFLLKIVLAILVPFFFPINVRISFFTSKRNLAEILIEISLNLYASLWKISIFTMSNLIIHGHVFLSPFI